MTAPRPSSKAGNVNFNSSKNKDVGTVKTYGIEFIKLIYERTIDQALCTLADFLILV
jgi:hypothetical protein